MFSWSDGNELSIWLEWVSSAYVHFRPESAHSGLFGSAVYMVANHPMYPVPAKLFRCYWVGFIKIDLDQVPCLRSLSFGLVCKEAEFVSALRDGSI